jgi:glutaredoxin-like protein NrdH
MNMKHITGKNKGKLVLYALSTCIWCKKTKSLLGDLGIDYYYIDVDLLEGADKSQATEELKTWNPLSSFPTLVINNEKCIIGFNEAKIREELGE